MASPDAVPAWFTAALDAPCALGCVRVDGIDIRYRSWGPASASGLILIHGQAAHARWWDHIGPLLADGTRVTALDLSGHGDSGRRDRYSLEAWAAEVAAVAVDGDWTGRPTVVGHSMGGGAALLAAATYPDDIGGAIAIDTRVSDSADEPTGPGRRGLARPLPIYATREAALARFRVKPDQPRMLPYVLDHVAKHSVRAVDNGWTWKFDHRIWSRQRLSFSKLTDLRGSAITIRCENGVLPLDLALRMQTKIGRGPVIELPRAGHHPMLDEPLELADCLRSLLAGGTRHGGYLPAARVERPQ